jgi:hypothetical protein
MPAPGATGGRERPDAHGGQDPNGENTELDQILSAIADEVNRHCAAVCDGVNMDFAARADHARKFLPRNQVAAALAAIKQARQAALAYARAEANARLKARRREATILYCRRRLPSIPSGWKREPGEEPKQ